MTTQTDLVETGRGLASPMDVRLRSRFTTVVAIAWLAACGGTPQAGTAPIGGLRASTDAPAPPRKPDPDLNPRAPARLLAIDWTTVKITTEADALALWDRIAPNGADWNEKLAEIPSGLDRALALALLRAGNFRCMPARPPRDCLAPQFDVQEPAATDGLADPCLRRLLAMWAIDQLEPEDVPSVMDALRAIVVIPPPESQLVVAAIHLVPEADHVHRLELLALTNQAGQRELADANVGTLDEPHLIEAVTKHHIDGALDGLSATAHRSTYLAAINDEALTSKARANAITELTSDDDKLAPEVHAALVKATSSRSCPVAARAVQALDLHGDHKYLPKRPNVRAIEPMMRALCVLASYEQLQRADESSLLATYVPAKGLERISVEYDALAGVDDDDNRDGDGDPHTRHSAELVPRDDQLVVPEIEDFGRALQHCKGTVCTSDDRQFQLGWKTIGGELRLYRLEIIERPPCPRS
ncbi:MAG: hypothetical protein H6Q90_5769 [Deltaproteobacteria bacterium]|nr:hypothetical protein [Deltaproteobacteria bacterium]